MVELLQLGPTTEMCEIKLDYKKLTITKVAHIQKYNLQTIESEDEYEYDA